MWLRLLRLRSSVILFADVYSLNGLDALRADIESLSKLLVPGQIGSVLRKKGHFSVVLIEPRKGTLIQVIPKLCELGISTTLLLDPKRVGLNQLRAEDEKILYRLLHSGVIQGDQTAEFLRQRFGPLPLNRLNPLIFPAMWRDIRKTVGLVNFGWRGEVFQSIEWEIQEMRRQVGLTPSIAWGKFSAVEEESWRQKGVAVLPESEVSHGMVSKKLACRRLREGLFLHPI